MKIPLLLALSFTLAGAPAMAADEPPHTVVERVGDIEIRDYAPMIVAEVEITGSRREASSRGFRPLAGYIFGGNSPREEIAMTAPVTTTRSGGQEIAMTAPVTTTPGEDGRWTVAFVMPEEWTMETLPEPDSNAVTLREVPGRRIAAIRFNGGGNDRAMMVHQAELEAFLDERGLTAIGEPVYAGYSPPWTPGPFRRNEVMIEIATE
jgi:SOUL heme-binding protein